MRLSLIGYRACGKSTVGRLLAGMLDVPFEDADAAIERATGCSIPSYFAREGEAAFRDREAECLAAVLAGEPDLVLATGGGAVLRQENRRLLRALGGHVVYLEVPAEVLQARLRRDHGDRPSLTGAGVADEVPRLLAIRDPLYRETADLVVQATATPEALAGEIVRLIAEDPRRDAGDRARRAPG